MARVQLGISVVSLAVMVACSASDGGGGIAAPHEPSLAKAPPPTLGDPTATFFFPTDDAALGLRSDGLYVVGGSSTYKHNECGVDAKIFATTEASNSGDAIMQTNNPRFSNKKCANYPRKMTIIYDANTSETIPVFMNVRRVHNTTSSIPIGTTELRAFSINPTQNSRCDILLWASERAVEPGVPIPADPVLVTRTGPDSWRVQTQAPPNNMAYCTTLGVSYPISIDFTIKTSGALEP